MSAGRTPKNALKGLALAAGASTMLLAGTLSANAMPSEPNAMPVAPTVHIQDAASSGDRVEIRGTCPYGDDPNTVVPPRAVYSSAFTADGVAKLNNGDPNGFHATALIDAKAPDGVYDVQLTCGDRSQAHTSINITRALPR